MRAAYQTGLSEDAWHHEGHRDPCVVQGAALLQQRRRQHPPQLRLVEERPPLLALALLDLVRRVGPPRRRPLHPPARPCRHHRRPHHRPHHRRSP
jgi:hypothetical protein